MVPNDLRGRDGQDSQIMMLICWIGYLLSDDDDFND